MTHKPDGKYAWTAKVGEKGQIVIPKEARDVFGIHPGDTVLLLGDTERGIALADETYSKYYDEFVVLLDTGLRVSEFCGLTRKGLDFNNRRIRMDHQLLR